MKHIPPSLFLRAFFGTRCRCHGHRKERGVRDRPGVVVARKLNIGIVAQWRIQWNVLEEMSLSGLTGRCECIFYPRIDLVFCSAYSN